jgi:hypothetical protein
LVNGKPCKQDHGVETQPAQAAHKGNFYCAVRHPNLQKVTDRGRMLAFFLLAGLNVKQLMSDI